MTESLEGLRRRIASASDLASVVGTMKSLAASSVSQYAAAVEALDEYYGTVELALIACLRDTPLEPGEGRPRQQRAIGAVVFGSDQGLVGRFNRSLAEYVAESLQELPGKKVLWAVGQRVAASLEECGLTVLGVLEVPSSVSGIASLVGQVQLQSEARRERGDYVELHLFHNRPEGAAGYQAAGQRLLPLDAHWRDELLRKSWPGKRCPEIVDLGSWALPGAIREYLFVTLYRACAQSLMSENSSRLAAMQRAQKNIDRRVSQLSQSFNRLRQNAIDEELFDVLSGYESLAARQVSRRPDRA